MQDFYKLFPKIRPNFPGLSIYPACAFNIGPQTVCVDHVDNLNYPSTPCAITAVGNFDCDRGGHLYLPTLKLYIRFPSGCTILISSASIQHGNTPIGPGEERCSITQYVPGGIVRYVQHKGQRVNQLVEDRAVYDGKKGKKGVIGDHWKDQLCRLSLYQDLEADRVFSSWSMKK
ncbi:uncharacterized protein BXZ73DRAFT_57400 [Epithele typhae]|uniref:uncharacterized protein n=1 Tax=Epithele typhae TaxID=378194 RepID=UPI002008E43D|nr:uncharacterized protein BXZ73DRAFT_57400 [Epithele typhae]KAH9911030.1 hypothetical protein BXZ73DRAFT_57400 [Epithele typhae]